MRILRADALLLLVAVIWGVGFVIQRMAMESVGPVTFTGVRLLIGTLSMLPLLPLARRLAPKTLKPVSRRRLLLGLIGAGLAMSFGAVLQQAGLVHTTAGIAGFITGLYVVFVPLLGLLVGYFVRWTTWVAVLVATGGLYLLSVQGQPTINPGDGLVLLGSVAWAAQMLITGWLALRCDPVRIAIFQTAFAGVLTLLVALPWEQPDFGAVLSIWPELLFSGVLAVGVAFLLQTIAQQDAPPAHTAVLLALEAVFGAWAGWAILNEQLTGIQIVGCLVIFVGIVLAQLRPPRPLEQRNATSPLN
ncbi:MAG: DMT family transporter [Phycisphaerales bacterium]|jgi:drug/metabolite transporter (DMT)-like permease|nr:DMT family transporter [Phycisphaerales bacterium]